MSQHHETRMKQLLRKLRTRGNINALERYELNTLVDRWLWEQLNGGK